MPPKSIAAACRENPRQDFHSKKSNRESIGDHTTTPQGKSGARRRGHYWPQGWAFVRDLSALPSRGQSGNSNPPPVHLRHAATVPAAYHRRSSTTTTQSIRSCWRGEVREKNGSSLPCTSPPTWQSYDDKASSQEDKRLYPSPLQAHSTHLTTPPSPLPRLDIPWQHPHLKPCARHELP